MKRLHERVAVLLVPLLLQLSAWADPAIESLRLEMETLKKRVTVLEQDNLRLKRELEVDRLVVRKELIVSDTGKAWEKGFEAQQLPRGIYARALHDGPGGLWVRSRLIKGEIDDPFDDRFHALEHNGDLRRTPGHISWNVWAGGAWRQMAIIQGEGVEFSEVPATDWDDGTHPGRIRLQTFRPKHNEPLTDLIVGQGRVSIGGGGFGGGGLPEPREVLELWGGKLVEHGLSTPSAPTLLGHDESGAHEYSLIAVGVQGQRSAASAPLRVLGRARLRWDSVPGADAYVVLRDGREIAGPLRLEGARKEWRDPESLK